MTDEAGAGTDGGARSTEALHSILASGDRRNVLRFFREREADVATLDELAEDLATRDGGVDDATEAKVLLHHAALPRLAETAAIDYDPRTRVARYRGPSCLEALLG